jgi:D-3-phosphoglycerate dehydrogenase
MRASSSAMERRMRILLADAFPDQPRAQLAALGHECVYEPDTTAEQLPDKVLGCDVLIVRSTRVGAETIEAADKLQLVVRAGSGIDTIDRDAAAARGIYVCNVPGGNAVAVAELTFGLLLALDRHIPDCVADLRAGRWDKKRYAKARGIHGRKVGVVGLGQVGLAFAERAAAFGAQVYAVAKPDRPSETLDRADAIGISFVDDLDTLAETCDVLSFHVPSTGGTTKLVGRELLARVQPGTIVLNTSRAAIVDEEALIEAMDAKGVRAGLDVLSGEPGQGTGVVESRLARHPNVYGTHHIGASTEQAQHAIAAEVVAMIEAYDAGTVLHCVNLAPPAVPDQPEQAGGLTLHPPRLLIVTGPLAPPDEESFARLAVASGSYSLARVDGDAEQVRRDAQRLRRVASTPAFTRPDEPASVVYRLTVGDHVQTGVVVEVSLDDYRFGRIRAHEGVRPERERQLSRFLEAAELELVPVTLIHPPRPGLQALLTEAAAGRPAVHLDSDDGVAQTVWIDHDPGLARAIRDELAGLDRLYIADGHHRMAAAQRYADDVGAQPIAGFVLGALFSADQMRVLGYHRGLVRPPGPASEFLRALAALPSTSRVEECALTDVPQPAPGTVSLRLDDRWYRIHLRSPRDDAGARAALDVALLDEGVLAPLLGVADVHSDPRVTPLPGTSDAGAVAAWCAQHHAVGFLLHPPSVDQVMAVADSEQLMPPKSTWFDPKARGGPFLRDLQSTRAGSG